MNSNECMKLLDNGLTIELYKNDENTYTAVCLPPAANKMLEEYESIGYVDNDFEQYLGKENHAANGKTPSEALDKLTNRVLFNKN